VVNWARLCLAPDSTQPSSQLHALVRQDQISFSYEGFEEAAGDGEQT
jgi:hypothetical protein